MAFTLNQFQAAIKGTVAGAATGTEEKKSVASKAVNKFVRAMPVHTGKFEDIVEELNEKHNNTDRQLWKNELMIRMVAQNTGTNLPSEEEMDESYDAYIAGLAKEAKRKAQEEAAAAKAKEEEKEGKKPAKKKKGKVDLLAQMRALIEEVEESDEETEVEEPEAQEEPKPAAKPQQRRFKCANPACRRKVAIKGEECGECSVEEPAQEETKPEPKKTGGRRKLKRQTSLIEE